MRRIYLSLAVLLLLGSQPVFSQTRTYMKLTDNAGTPIEGESVSDTYPKSVELIATSDLVENCSTGMCKASLKELTFQLVMDKSLILLRKEFFLGKALRKVEVFYTTGGFSSEKPVAFSRLVLGNAYITSIQQTANDNGLPTVQITFAPAQIGWAYKARKADGSFLAETLFGWDLSQNTLWLNF